MVNINKTIEQIKELGPKKAAGYSLLAIGIFGLRKRIFNSVR